MLKEEAKRGRWVRTRRIPSTQCTSSLAAVHKGLRNSTWLQFCFFAGFVPCVNPVMISPPMPKTMKTRGATIQAPLYHLSLRPYQNWYEPFQPQTTRDLLWDDPQKQERPGVVLADIVEPRAVFEQPYVNSHLESALRCHTPTKTNPQYNTVLLTVMTAALNPSSTARAPTRPPTARRAPGAGFQP